MPDKMMRVAGRGEDGTAKALSVDNSGKLRPKGTEVVKHTHTYNGEVGWRTDYFYGQIKTSSVANGHRVLNVSEYEKTVVVYKNSTDKIRTVRLFITHDAPFFSSSLPYTSLSNIRIEVIRVEVPAGETFVFKPRSIDFVNGYKELDIPKVGLSVNATFLGAEQETNGTEEITYLLK